jgi:translation initiation factor IF-3
MFIRVPEVRLLEEDGSQVGIMPTQKALEIARNKGLDLVEVAPLARPPVCKIIDYNKFKYLEAKKVAQSKKSAQQVDTKEIHLGPFTSEGDLQVRLKRVKEFLEDGDRVKVVVKFRGREITKPEFGKNLIRKITNFVTEEELGKLEREARLEGKQLIASYTPSKSKE